MKKGKYSLLDIKHEINNIIFKLKTATEILSEENITVEEKKHVVSILKTNINEINLLFENLFLMEKVPSLKKEKIYLKEFFDKNVSKRYIYGYPSLLSASIVNLREMGIGYSIKEKNGKLILKANFIPENKLHRYIFYITEYFLNLNGIKLEV